MSGSAERPTEVKTAEDFFLRLNEPDAITIRSIVEAIHHLAQRYRTDNELLPGVGSYGFFGVYGIAGVITKEGERPDVDILIATNAHWSQSYYSPGRSIVDTNPIIQSGDWIAGTLLDKFGNEGYKVELVGEIPSEYGKVGANPKVLIRLTPKDAQAQIRKRIDVVYVKTCFVGRINCLADFETIDVDDRGEALPRIDLLKVENLGRMVRFSD